MARTRRVRHAAPRHARYVRHFVSPHATVVKTTVKQTESAPAAPAAVTTVDRKTVIHRNDAGDVTRRTRVDRQDANGNQTRVFHESHSDAGDPPPPPSSPN